MVHNSAVRRVLALTVLAALLSSCGVSEARNRALAEAAVQPLSASNNWQPGLVGLPDYPAHGWGPAGYPDVTASTATGNLDPVQEFLSNLSLKTSDLSNGVKVKLIDKGDTLSGATLDFCAGSYPSETLRVARRQVAAFDSAGAFAGFSTEVVQYESSDAAMQAITELVTRKTACVDGTTYTSPSGAQETINFFTAPGPTNTVLVAANQRVILHAVVSSATETHHQLIVVQVRGNTLLGFYATETGKTPFEQSVLDSLFGLVSKLTERLNSASASDIGQF